MLLDTHVWIRAASGEPRLGARTRRALNREAAAGGVHVSAISAFEIAALSAAGRLVLNQPVERWIRDSIARGNLRVLELDTGVAIDAGAIGADAVGDPIDRLLIATARDAGVPLVTRDRRLLDFATRTGVVRALDAAR